MYVLERDLGSHADDLEPIGAFNTLKDAQVAAQRFESEPLKWSDYSGNLGGWINSHWYPRFRITEVPVNEVKS